jgi:hypothetical protein
MLFMPWRTASSVSHFLMALTGTSVALAAGFCTGVAADTSELAEINPMLEHKATPVERKNLSIMALSRKLQSLKPRVLRGQLK